MLLCLFLSVFLRLPLSYLNLSHKQLNFSVRQALKSTPSSLQCFYAYSLYGRHRKVTPHSPPEQLDSSQITEKQRKSNNENRVLSFLQEELREASFSPNTVISSATFLSPHRSKSIKKNQKKAIKISLFPRAVCNKIFRAESLWSSSEKNTTI